LSIRLTPLHDRVVIRQLQAEEQSKGGLIIPEGAKERPTLGIVVCTGPGRVTETGALIPIPVELQEGALVLFTKFAGTPADLDGDDLLLVRASDILGVVRPKLELD